MELVTWLVVSVVVLAGVLSLVWICFAAFAFYRGACSWKALVGIVLSRGIMVAACLLTIAGVVFGVAIKRPAVVLVPILLASFLWNQLVLRRERPSTRSDSPPADLE